MTRPAEYHDRVRAIPERIASGELTPLDAIIKIRRLKVEIETVEKKIREDVLDQCRSIGADKGPVRFNKVNVHLEMRRKWIFDHDPQWVSANNRRSTIERELIEGFEHDEPRAAKRGLPEYMVRIDLKPNV